MPNGPRPPLPATAFPRGPRPFAAPAFSGRSSPSSAPLFSLPNGCSTALRLANPPDWCACRMIFERVWALFLLPLPLGWLALGMATTARAARPCCLKVMMVIAVIFALAEPVLQTHDRKVALAALVDTSASITR